MAGRTPREFVPPFCMMWAYASRLGEQMAKKRQDAARRRRERAQRSAAGRGETNDPLLREAELQTQAIMRLDVYKRIAYSLVAIGAVLVGVGFFGGLGTTWGVVGIVLLVVGIPASAVLYVGTKHGRQNVENMIYDYDLKHGTSEQHKRERDVALKGETPAAIRRANERAEERLGRKSKR